MYVGEEVEEPAFQYIPESPRVVNGEIDPLHESLLLLKDGLDDGTAIAQFDVSQVIGVRCLLVSLVRCLLVSGDTK